MSDTARPYAVPEGVRQSDAMREILHLDAREHPFPRYAGSTNTIEYMRRAPEMRAWVATRLADHSGRGPHGAFLSPPSSNEVCEAVAMGRAVAELDRPLRHFEQKLLLHAVHDCRLAWISMARASLR